MSVLQEKEQPHWTSTKGVYADFSKGLDQPEFYAKCPTCGHVHGMYKSAQEAALKRYCPLCDFKRHEKLKKEIVKAANYESAPHLIVGLLLEQDDEEEIKHATGRAIGRNWKTQAKWDLEQHTNLSLEARNTPYEPVDNPDESPLNQDDNAPFFLVLNNDSYHYRVFKDYDSAYTTAKEDVEAQLRDEPSLFTQDWLEGHINAVNLAQALRADEEESMRDRFFDEFSSTEEQRDKLIDEGFLERTDFFGEDDEELPMNDNLESKVSEAAESYIEKTVSDALADPVGYLKDMLGDEDGTAQAIKIGGIDYDAAAKDAVSTDGPGHFLAQYDNEMIELPNDAVAFRIN